VIPSKIFVVVAACGVIWLIVAAGFASHELTLACGAISSELPGFSAAHGD
jgi:hypothetical protein